MKIVGISGNISAPSRTRSLVENIVNNAAQKAHTKYTLIDIAQFAPELGSTVTYDNFPKVLSDAYQAIAEADLIVIGTPVGEEVLPLLRGKTDAAILRAVG
jgi:FMN reductase